MNPTENTMEKEQRKFKTKLKLLKRLVRQTVFENAALCDECVTVSDKLNKVSSLFLENRVLVGIAPSPPY